MSCSLDYSHFDARSYLITRYSNLDEEWIQILLQCFHVSYQKYHTPWDPNCTRLLEFGGGPSILPLISAAPFVSEIVFSDYAESSRTQVQLWRDNDPKAYNWSPYFKHVARLEGSTDISRAADVREGILRSKIRYVIPCDINAEEPLLQGGEASAAQEPFNIISVSGCIEAAVNSASEYQRALGKLRGLLVAGGLLLGAAFLGSTGYEVEGTVYHGFPLSEDLVITSLRRAGFTVQEHRHVEFANILTTAKDVLFFVAKAT